MFFMMRPISGETTVAYGIQLRENESECDFGDSCEDRIFEHLVQTVNNQTLMFNAFGKNGN